MNTPTSPAAREMQRWPHSEAEAREAWEAASRLSKAATAAAYRDPSLQVQQALVVLLCLFKCTAITLGLAIPLVALGFDTVFALLIGAAITVPPVAVLRDLFWTNLFAEQGALAFDAEIARRRAAAFGEHDPGAPTR